MTIAAADTRKSDEPSGADVVIPQSTRPKQNQQLAGLNQRPAQSALPRESGGRQIGVMPETLRPIASRATPVVEVKSTPNDGVKSVQAPAAQTVGSQIFHSDQITDEMIHKGETIPLKQDGNKYDILPFHYQKDGHTHVDFLTGIGPINSEFQVRKHTTHEVVGRVRSIINDPAEPFLQDGSKIKSIGIDPNLKLTGVMGGAPGDMPAANKKLVDRYYHSKTYRSDPQRCMDDALAEESSANGSTVKSISLRTAHAKLLLRGGSRETLAPLTPAERAARDSEAQKDVYGDSGTPSEFPYGKDNGPSGAGRDRAGPPSGRPAYQDRGDDLLLNCSKEELLQMKSNFAYRKSEKLDYDKVESDAVRYALQVIENGAIPYSMRVQR